MVYDKLYDYDYHLPDELIATHPASPRDHSRLLVLDKKTGKIEHKHFYDIIDYLNAGDILVLNNSKVIPARLWGFKKDTGGKVEVLLHKKLSADIWQCLLGGRVSENLNLEFSKGLNAVVLRNNHDGTWDVRFNKSDAALMKIIEKIGEMPLPPYIENQRKEKREERVIKEDKKEYQTVFADPKKAGSVAAPTAGLHFTPELLKKIKKKGVKILEITLYVGLGTFAPVKTKDITKHKMHAEWVEIDRGAIDQIIDKREKRSGKIIAVGTTSARGLEACFSDIDIITHPGPAKAGPPLSRLRIALADEARGEFKKWVDIFIYPGYKFKIVDALITNFHLPKSTLLMLVSALAGKKNIDKAYREAIKKKYRFYSYGDAMFIK